MRKPIKQQAQELMWQSEGDLRDVRETAFPYNKLIRGVKTHIEKLKNEEEIEYWQEVLKEIVKNQ